MATGSPSGEVLGMDWSKQPGESEISSAILDFEHRPVADPSPFIVVHGAGLLLGLFHHLELDLFVEIQSSLFTNF